MKEVIDFEGKKISVSLDTPVKTINGVHYLLTPEDEAEIDARTTAWEDKAAERAKAAVIAARKRAYGPIEKQIEYITENGLEAWQAKVAQIKLDNPKPE